MRTVKLRLAGVSLSVLLLLDASWPARAAAQQAEGPKIEIVIVQGEGAINNIKLGVKPDPVVLIQDENQKPVSGATVTFFLPAEGPSGLFPNQSRILTLFSDDKGKATARGIRLNPDVGLMRIRVTASLFSQTASAVITETNVTPAALAKGKYQPPPSNVVPKKGLGKKKLVIILAVVAVAGAFIATRKKSSSSTK
jgi:hypothetical protein